MGEEKIPVEETFEEYQARLKKMEARAEMIGDGFFREKPPKREKDEWDKVLY